jgi:energy-coupling factor transport system permease protein
MIHPLAWAGWLAGVLAMLSATRNPLHLALVLLCILLVDAASQPAHIQIPYALSLSPLSILLTLSLISALLNGLTVRYGQTVLFRLPDWLPLLGGPVTLEALVFGVLSGLVLSGMLLAFRAAQRSLPISSLIGFIPRAFYPLAVVTAIAITFVPVTLRQARQIREAQAIRGHRLRTLRDWLPLLLPLLVQGLERSIQLAESMAARGFAGGNRPTSRRDSLVFRSMMVAGLAALLAGWLLVLVWGQGLLGRLLMAGGGGALAVNLWAAGRRVRRTHYRQPSWRVRDSMVLIGVAIVMAVLFLPLPGVDRAALAYYPYPLFRLPRFDPVLGFATLGLAWPALGALNDR